MRILIQAAVVLLGFAMAAQVGGCVRTSDSSLSSKETDPLRGDSVGYYEVAHEGVVYVVGSIQSRDAVRNGKIPATTPGNFSSQGQSVLFETNNTGLAQRLMGEYDRRHGLSSR